MRRLLPGRYRYPAGKPADLGLPSKGTLSADLILSF